MSELALERKCLHKPQPAIAQSPGLVPRTGEVCSAARRQQVPETTPLIVAVYPSRISTAPLPARGFLRFPPAVESQHAAPPRVPCPERHSLVALRQPRDASASLPKADKQRSRKSRIDTRAELRRFSSRCFSPNRLICTRSVIIFLVSQEKRGQTF